MAHRILLFLILLSGTVYKSYATELTEDSLIRSIDSADSERTLYLFGGLSIIKIKDSIEQTRASRKDESLLERAQRYLQTHELEWQLPEKDQLIEEARTKKLKKFILPVLLALKLKFVILLPLVLLAITVVSLKGMAAGSLALLFSGATLLRDLFANRRQQHVTTAYITGINPYNAGIQHSDWNRNAENPGQELYQYSTLPHVFDK